MIEIATYDLPTLQIYFNASLELQEELIKKGFSVPFKTPIPIIYSDKRGRGTVRKQYVINPERYGKTPSELGWVRKGSLFTIPSEVSRAQAKLEIILNKHLLHLVIVPSDTAQSYHLEKASSRAVNPEKWTNWAMLYLDIPDLIDLINKLIDKIGFPENLCNKKAQIFREVVPNPGGKEYTFYIALNPHSYNLCLGCFNFVIDYLKKESKSSLRSINLKGLKLCLTNDPNIPVGIKVGFARITNLNPQFMMKLFTVKGTPPKTIQGIKGEVKGKPRGKLVFCDHTQSKNEIVVDAHLFLHVICCLAHAFKLKDNFPVECKNCYKLRARLPTWF